MSIDLTKLVTTAMKQALKTQQDLVTAENTKNATDAVSAKAHVKLTALKNMSPAQVQAWVTTNVTTLAQAQDAITTLAIAVSLLARKL